MHAIIRTAAVVVLAWAAAAVPGRAASEEYFWDDFNDGIRDPAKWRKSPYMDNTALFRETGGRLLFLRNAAETGRVQSVQWDGRFLRTYDGGDNLMVKATVRAPHKIRTPGQAYQAGIGVTDGGARFIELTVQDDSRGRFFNVYFYDSDTEAEQSTFFDAPQNVTRFDLLIDYSARLDRFTFYWSTPGVDYWFQIGQPAILGRILGGAVPRSLQPFVSGYLFEGAPVSALWNAGLDDFVAWRQDAP